MQQGTTISERIGSARVQQIESNRQNLKTISEILLVCSHQEIALRGHEESKTSLNRGNFLYTSADIENGLLNVMGSIVQNQICADVMKGGFYSILADESKECSKHEQMAIVLRYVDVETVYAKTYDLMSKQK